MKVHPLVWGLLAGYVLGLFVPLHKARRIVGGGTGNVMGNAGGFTGGNPGTPQGPGFFGP